MRNKKLIVLFSVVCAIALLIVLNSVIFSVQQINAYCYNETGEATSAKVLENHGIKNHRNIFMIKESEAIKNIESKVPNVRVINIEKQFPNKLYINYVEVSEYLKIYSGGSTYFCSNDGKILRKEDGIVQDENSIELIIKGVMNSTEVGQTFSSDNSNDLILIRSLLQSLEQLGYRKYVVDLIKKIDITHNVNIVMTTATGMTWTLVGGEYCLKKLQGALSVYVKTGDGALSDDQKKTGTLIVTGGNPEVKCQYVPAPPNV